MSIVSRWSPISATAEQLFSLASFPASVRLWILQANCGIMRRTLQAVVIHDTLPTNSRFNVTYGKNVWKIRSYVSDVCIVAAATELTLNVSSTYDDYWVKTGQLHSTFTGICTNIVCMMTDEPRFVSYFQRRTLTLFPNCFIFLGHIAVLHT